MYNSAINFLKKSAKVFYLCTFICYTVVMSRSPAKNQPLPRSESEYLATLSDPQRNYRLHALFNAGWTLQALGDALTPQRPRTTVRLWVTKGPKRAPTEFEPLPEPTPGPATYKKSAKSAPIDNANVLALRALAYGARRYRSSIPPGAPAAEANTQFNILLASLYAEGVAISDLAAASEVTYRAIAKRLGRA